MRPPEWRPSDAVASGTRAALTWWRERFPRRRRPAWQDERDEFLAYAWTFHNCSLEQIRYVADTVLTRSNDHWPDHAEIEAEIRHLAERGKQRREAQTHVATRWSGREDDACPHCHTMPTYAIALGTARDHWVYHSPACSCCGVQPCSTPSLWLRGIFARPEDNPVELAALYRESSEGLVSEWRRTGRPLAAIVSEMTDLMSAVRA